MGQAAHNRSLVRQGLEVVGVKERLNRDLMVDNGNIALAGDINNVIEHLINLKMELDKKGYHDISIAPAKKDSRRLELWGIREEKEEERKRRMKRLEQLRQRRLSRDHERLQVIQVEHDHIIKLFQEASLDVNENQLIAKYNHLEKVSD